LSGFAEGNRSISASIRRVTLNVAGAVSVSPRDTSPKSTPPRLIAVR
jgi:hypothetical protein